MERLRFRELAKEKLLQHGELSRAEKIKDPENISGGKLDLWLNFAREVCSTHGFLALAFTELKPEIREYLGFGRDLQPRVMFYREKVEEPGFLVINPIAEIPVFGNPKIPQLEGCGSLDFGKSLYFIKRPEVSVIRGFFYNGEYDLQPFYEPKSIYDDRSIHEIDHLDGKTALDFPKDFMDPRQKGDWQEIMKVYGHFQEDFIRGFLAEKAEAGIIVFDRKQRKFLHVDPRGI